MRAFLAVLCVLVFSGCSGAKLSQTARSEYTGPPITAIALAPGGGPLTDSIAVELFNAGLTVVEPDQALNIVGRLGLTEIELASPEGYDALANAGVDALLLVKGVFLNDGTPESASVRLTSTVDGTVVAGLTWQNGWGGERGSIMDRQMRKNLTEASSQMAKALIQRLE